MITPAEFLLNCSIFGVHTGGGGGGSVTSITAGAGLTGGTITTSGTIALAIPVTAIEGGTGLTSFGANSLLYASGANTWAALASANNALLITGVSGIPAFSTTLPSGLTIPGYLPLAGGTMQGDLTLFGAPTTDNMAATKLYVDQTVVSLTPTQPVQLASTGNFVSTYDNGTAGVGATLTATSTGVVSLDGVVTVVNKDYLFKDQTDNTQNGAYTCTTAGAIGVAAIFTRATWFNTPAAITAAGLTPVLNGDTQAGQAWYEVNDVTTIGTDPIVFVRFGNSGTVTSITAGTGLTGGTITGTGTIALAIPVTTPDGGTGIISPTAHNLLIGAGASAMSLLAPSATSGVPLISQGVAADPIFGTTAVAGGGTGLTALTAHNMIIGNGTSAATLLAPSATSGVPLISQGASADPIFGTTAVAGGGTGLTALTAHNMVIGNGTSAATLLAPSATSGIPLISQGASADPAYGTTVVGGGGTGLTAVTAHNIPIGNGTSALNLLAPSATAGIPLISQGVSSDPSYGTAVVGGGGTGLATTTAYGLIAGGTTATGNFQNVGTGAVGTLLQGAGNAALPAWTTATYPATTTVNQLLYSSATNVIGGLATANNAVLSTNGSGVPVLSTTLPSGLTIPGYSTTASGAQVLANVVGNGTTVNYGVNVSSATHPGTGQHVINFTSGFSSVNYITHGSSLIAATLQYCIVQSQSTGSVTINTYNSGGTLTDPTQLLVVCFGA